jgi:hypothetical protein
MSANRSLALRAYWRLLRSNLIETGLLQIQGEGLREQGSRQKEPPSQDCSLMKALRSSQFATAVRSQNASSGDGNNRNVTSDETRTGSAVDAWNNCVSERVPTVSGRITRGSKRLGSRPSKGDQRTAQVINLGHGGTSIGFRTTTTVPDLCRRPHSFWTHKGHAADPSVCYRLRRSIIYLANVACCAFRRLEMSQLWTG